jgi:hypothetical protein
VLIDLNAERSARAARREGGGQNITVPFGTERFTLPAELPLVVIDRLLDPDVEIAQLAIIAVRAFTNSRDDEAGTLIVATLTEHPDLPAGFMRAVLSCVEQLFGADQWTRFQALQPSAQDMVALLKGLFRSYGSGLGEAFSSPAPAASDGTTSKPTSNVTTTLTPEPSGPTPPAPDTLASVG